MAKFLHLSSFANDCSQLDRKSRHLDGHLHLIPVKVVELRENLLRHLMDELNIFDELNDLLRNELKLEVSGEVP